jgi:mono/diheme cytochrome c family protein
MTDERAGRELTPHSGDESGSRELVPSAGEARDVERFSAGPQAHTVGLTEERSAKIVRQSASARSVVFLAILLIAIFIPVYWFYENGIPALGTDGRLTAEAEHQYVTDVERGYELYLANCARCHGENGQGGVGPPLNDQAKLYNALTPDLQSGTGHLNPDYIRNVMSVGGRYVCGDPNSLMAAWLAPDGPLNYRQVDELIAWITASSEITFEYAPESHEEGAEHVEPVVVSGWRDPNWQPAPGAPPPPACWKAPNGLVPAGTASGPTTPAASPAGSPAPDGGPDASAPPTSGGTPEEPRVIALQATADLRFKDEAGNVVTQIVVAPGETVQFDIDNTAGFDHNFYIGTPEELSVPNGTTEVGIPAWQSGVQSLTWTAEGEGLQFACTVPGHYSTMSGNIVVSG